MTQLAHFVAGPARRAVAGRLLPIVAAALLFCTAQAGGGEAPAVFRDLPSGHWAEEAVIRLSEEGILIGYPDGRFGGERTLTRYEMAVIVARLLERLERLAQELMGEASQGVLERAGLQDPQRGVPQQEDRAARGETAPTDLEQAATRAELAALQARVAALEAALDLASLDPAAPDEAVLSEEVAGEGPAGAPALAGLPFAAAQNGEVFVPGLGLVGPDGAPAGRLYVGVAPGIASSSGFVAFGVQAGYDRLFGPAGVVARLHYDSALGARLSGGVQLRFSPFEAPLELYGGLGVGLVLGETDSRTLLELPLGLEVYLTPRYGLFVQLVSSVFPEEGGVDSYLSAGLNLRF